MAPCPWCGGAMPPRKAGRGRPRIYCSDPCTRAANRAKRGPDSPTKSCTREGCDNRMRAKGLCSYHYKVEFYPDWRTRWPEDPAIRRKRLRARTQLRRARLRDVAAEPIDRDDIGTCDGWRCGLCGCRVNAGLEYPHPQSASLDHIEPLSLGGKHIRTNVQIAHLACNIAKGNRGGGEQMLLIG